MLPRPVAPISGETLSSYLPRLAQANHLTLTEVLIVLCPGSPRKSTTPTNSPSTTCLSALTAIPSWPMSQAAIPHHWRHRLLTLQTTNQHRDLGTEHDAYTRAARYPDAIALAAETFSIRENEQDPMTKSTKAAITQQL